MSRPQESMKRCLKSGNCILNITIQSKQPLHKIVDSLKGIDGATIDAKQIGEGDYDFIIDFGIKDYKGVFHEKFAELYEILGKDFPGYKNERMHKYQPERLKRQVLLGEVRIK